MTDYITAYLKKNPNKENDDQFQQAIADFCFNYPIEFKEKFTSKIKLKPSTKLKRSKPDKKITNKFINHLANENSEPIFLLRDCYDFLKLYQKKKNQGIGILLNRPYLCRNEQDYFILINLFSLFIG